MQFLLALSKDVCIERFCQADRIMIFMAFSLALLEASALEYGGGSVVLFCENGGTCPVLVKPFDDALVEC